jgi:oligopeptide transport system substrate-binding protein
MIIIFYRMEESNMLKKVLSAVLALIMLVGIMAGCGQSATPGNESTAAVSTNPSETSAAAPAKTSSRDNVTLVVGSEPATLDPGSNNSADGGTYILHLFEGLTRQDVNGKTIPGIAESWDISTDGLKYTFHLRDAKWSDGQPVKASDFEYAWKRALSPELASEYAYQVWYLKNGYEYNTGKAKAEDVGVKATDDKTLEVELAAPTSYFLELCRFPTYMPVRKDVVEAAPTDWFTKPETLIGDGAYKMKSWEHSSQLVFEKNDTYWDAANTGFIKTLTWTLLEDEAAALSGFEAGEIDIVDQLVPQAEIQNLVADGKCKIHDLLGTYYIYLNNSRAPFDNPKVRLALSLAIDRQYIVDKVSRGGQLPATGIVPYKVPDADSSTDFRTKGGELLPKTADIAKAKQLLAEAGYPDGKGFPEVEMYYNTMSGHKAIMEAVTEMWKTNLGITSFKTPNMEWKVLQEKVNSGDFWIARMGWIGDYVDPMTFFDMFISDSSQNQVKFNNAEYDKLILAAKNSNDQALRMDNMHKAEKIFVDETGAIPLYFYVAPMLENPAIKDWRFDPMAFLFMQYAYVE